MDKHISVACDGRRSPLAWVEEILKAAEKRSDGRVERCLVGAKLEVRHPNTDTGHNAGFAEDAQAGGRGDFCTGRAVYHVAAAPSASVISRCKENLEEGLCPVLLVPRAAVKRAKGLAQADELEHQIMVFAIEDFIAHNIVEVGEERRQPFFDTLQQIIQVYNQRIQAAEIDESLRLEIR